jgi:phosphoglycolate phosphatase
MPQSNLRAVLFDWDGTLVDSAEASFRCFEAVLVPLGIAFDRARFQQTYSPNWYKTYEVLGLREDLWSEADRRWTQEYAQQSRRLIPGAREALQRLAEAGLRQALVTSGNRERVKQDLLELEVRAFFRTVVCAEDVVRRKPHPEGLLMALGHLGLLAGEVAYVGDSPEDVEMARAAGVFSVGIPGGFPNREALRTSAPDVWATSLDEAVGALLSGSGR